MYNIYVCYFALISQASSVCSEKNILSIWLKYVKCGLFFNSEISIFKSNNVIKTVMILLILKILLLSYFLTYKMNMIFCLYRLNDGDNTQMLSVVLCRIKCIVLKYRFNQKNPNNGPLNRTKIGCHWQSCL